VHEQPSDFLAMRDAPSNDGKENGQARLTRRVFMTAASASAAAMPFAGPRRASTMERARPGAAPPPPSRDTLRLRVNDQDRELAVDPRTTLLDALREQLGLTGTKKGCDHGQCGACTVLANGKPVLSCLTLALTAEGHEVVTIEGLARPDGSLHPVQQAFIDHDGFQCGYCTPGQIMSAVACIEGGHAGSEEQIREFMSGNLCRCAAYPNIVAAILQARAELKGS